MEKAKPCVLITDDEESTLQFLESLLKDDFRLALTQSGMEALAYLSHNRVDAFLLDIHMPHMTGFDVLDRMNELNIIHTIPVIILNTQGGAQDLETAFKKGAIDSVAKPFNRNELLLKLKTAIRIKLQQDKIVQLVHRIRYGYRRFISFDFLKQLSRKSILEIELGESIHKILTVLFFDITSFNAPDFLPVPVDNVKLVNSCLKQIGPIIRNHYGFIHTCLGNRVLALFPKSADDAVKAAVKISKEFPITGAPTTGTSAIGTPLAGDKSNRKVKITTGIHTNRYTLGTIGELRRISGAVLSRSFDIIPLMGNCAKKFGTDILISNETLMALHDPNAYFFRIIDMLKMAGSSSPVSLFEIITLENEALEKRRSTLRDFESGILLYQKKEFGKALTIFRNIVEKDPADDGARMYIQRCEFFLKYTDAAVMLNELFL